MKKRIFISLKWQLNLAISLIVGIILFIIYFLFPYVVRELRVEDFQKRAEQITEETAIGLSVELTNHNNEDIKNEFDKLIQRELITYLLFYSEEEILYQHNKFNADLVSYENIQSENVNDKWNVVKSYSPIYHNNIIIGKLYVGFSLFELNKSIDELTKIVGYLNMTIFLIGTILVIIMNHLHLNPLRKISKAVEKISYGDITQYLAYKSINEFGIISESINSMIKKIANSDLEMSKIKKELENRVIERTQELERVLNSLRIENIQRKKAEVEISSSLHEKEVLLKEIHHRVKNNLQIVSSLFFFQSKQISDPTTLEMFRDGQNRVKSMALIHEKLYQSGDLANIDFKEYLKKLTNFLMQSYGTNQSRIKLKNNIHNVELGVDAAVPCGLIVNELISNSLKHAFRDRENGEIRIDMGYDESDKLILKISDNGIGIPENMDIEKSDSLGLRLVYNLTSQLNGKIEFYSNGGTIVKIAFPKPNLKKVS